MTRPAVELDELPDCDVCEVTGHEPINKATADSFVTAPHSAWGYTCDMHAYLRKGRITPLIKVER